MTALTTATSIRASSIESTPRSILSRIWPFGSKRVQHRTFGSLKPWRNGNYLRTKANFAPLDGKIWVVIQSESGMPTTAQEKLFLLIEKNFHAMLPKVLAALFEEYKNVRQVQTRVRWPEITKAEDLHTVIPLDAIWLEAGDGHPFVFSFQSELDKDHEFHVFFKNGRLDHVAFEH